MKYNKNDNVSTRLMNIDKGKLKLILLKMNIRFVNTKELARHLSLSENTIRAWVKRGYIPYSKFGSAVRFDMLEIEKWTKKRKCTIDVKWN